MDFDTFDTDLLSEIQDSDAEIFDIEDSQDDNETFNQLLNSNLDFWWHLIPILSLVTLLLSLVWLV